MPSAPPKSSDSRPGPPGWRRWLLAWSEWLPRFSRPAIASMSTSCPARVEGVLPSAAAAPALAKAAAASVPAVEGAFERAGKSWSACGASLRRSMLQRGCCTVSSSPRPRRRSKRRASRPWRTRRRAKRTQDIRRTRIRVGKRIPPTTRRRIVRCRRRSPQPWRPLGQRHALRRPRRPAAPSGQAAAAKAAGRQPWRPLWRSSSRKPGSSWAACPRISKRPPRTAPPRQTVWAAGRTRTRRPRDRPRRPKTSGTRSAPQ
mmetsp:Transcript_116228/g.333770  ORF Transcript_116228/g.333770 Transcript_116228/m.333770 type:complete len:259 (+) Transcript_116228:780-1556(+)